MKDDTCSPSSPGPDLLEKDKREANVCIGLGVGVGALGAAGAAVSAAVCPICFVVAPALVAAGVVKRVKLRRRRGKKEE